MMTSFGAANFMTPEGKAQLADAAFNETRQDAKRFEAEIAFQLKMKMNDKLYFEKREKSDFVKATRSENLMFRQ